MSAVMTAEARDGLISTMQGCEQTSGLTVLAHGEMVRDHYRDLIGYIRNGKPLEYQWRLPDWIGEPALLAGLMPDDVMAEYHLFHDVVIHTPQDTSTQKPLGRSRVRVRTTTITNADEDISQDCRTAGRQTRLR